MPIIEMLQTVEDSHRYVEEDTNGDPVMRFDVQKFMGGAQYRMDDRRAKKLVERYGYAKYVNNDG